MSSKSAREPAALAEPTTVGRSSTALVRAEGVGRVFETDDGEVTALEDVGLTIQRGDFVAFLGPSGCGKSTLMNMIAGLVKPTSGALDYAGEPVPGINTAVGYMTQQDSILPWRTVRRNVELPLELEGVSRSERRERAQRMIEKVRLDGFEDRYPVQLSGGMRKRVGLAQTLVADPETMLLDEPFGALDAMLKIRLQEELLAIVEDSERTIVFVTHDINEAIVLANWVVVFTARPGRIKANIAIDIPRPRRPSEVLFSARARELQAEIWQHLESEVTVT